MVIFKSEMFEMKQYETVLFEKVSSLKKSEIYIQIQILSNGWTATFYGFNLYLYNWILLNIYINIYRQIIKIYII